MPNLRQLVFCRLLKTSTPFIRGRLILSRPLFWFVQTSPRAAPACAPLVCRPMVTSLPLPAPVGPCQSLFATARCRYTHHHAKRITLSASPQATRPVIRFCSSRATIFRPLRFPSLGLAPLPRLPLVPAPLLFAVRWSPACPFLRQSVPVSPSLRRLVAVTHIITPSASSQATMSATAPSTMSPQAAPPPRLSQLAPSCASQPRRHLPAPPCAPGPFLRTRASENYRGE